MRPLPLLISLMAISSVGAHTGVTWFTYDQGIAQAQGHPERPMFIFVSEERCYITFRWLFSVFNQDNEISRILEYGFINVKVDFIPFGENPLLETLGVENGQDYFIPTFIIFSHGQEVWRSCACLEESELLKILKRFAP